jgi:hypothetical protein
MRKRPGALASFLVLVLSVFLVGGLTAGAATTRAVSSQVKGFSDPSGDARGGADIRSLTISDTGGLLTFTFKVVNLKVNSTTGVVDTGVLTWLDTNLDRKDDYAFLFGVDSEGPYYDVMKIPSFKSVPASPTLSYTASGNTHVFRASSTDLGGTLGFTFNIASAAWDESGKRTDLDSAPDAGTWAYALTSVKPVIGTPTASPAKPVAGKAFTMTVPVTRSDTGAKVATGATIAFEPTISGTVIAHGEQLIRGTGVLHLKVPITAKGKQLRIQITTKMGVQTATRAVTLPIG